MVLDNFRKQHITWDKANRKVYENVRVSSEDENGRKLAVQIVNDGVVEDLTGFSLSLAWETRDKVTSGLDAFEVVDISKGQFAITYKTGMLQNVGNLNAQLVLIGTGASKITSENFTITVFGGVGTDGAESSNEFSALTTALATVNQYDARIESKADKSTTDEKLLSLNQQLAEKASKEKLDVQESLVFTLSSNIETGLLSKVDKDSPNSVSWAMLKQDARTNISGDKVATVGLNSVSTDNVVDNSITFKKRAGLGDMGLIYSSADYPDFDTINKTLTIKSPVRISYGNQLYNVDVAGADQVVISLTDSQNYNKTYGVVYFDVKTKNFITRDVSRLGTTSENEILIALVSTLGKKAYMIGPYTVDGKIPALEGGADWKVLTEKRLELFGTNTFKSLEFEFGSINSTSLGQNTTKGEDGSRLRSTGYFKVKKGDFVLNSSTETKQMSIWFYNIESKEWLSNKTIGFPDEKIRYNFEGSYYVRFVFSNVDNAKITDIPDFISSFSFITEGQEVEGNNNTIVTNDAGKEFLFKFNISSGGTYLSDHTFVGDEFWNFPVSNDSHTSWVDVGRYEIDFELGTATKKGTFKHNWGHANTVDYNHKNNCIVVGNGSTSTSVEPMEFYVFENADLMKNETQVDVSTAIKYNIELDGFDWGKQLNVVWGQDNLGRCDIVYGITNYNSKGVTEPNGDSSDTQEIRKIMLGKGANDLGNGTLLPNKDETQFNGTYKVLKKYTHPYERDYANQGTQFYNGILYEGIAHDRVSFFEKVLADDGVIRSKLNRERVYDETGKEFNFTVEGIAIKNNHIFIGSFMNEVFVYRL